MQKLTPKSFFENYIYNIDSLTQEKQNEFLRSVLKLLLVIKKIGRQNIYIYDDIFGGVVQLYNLLKSAGLQSSRNISQIISLISKKIIGDQELIANTHDGIIKYSNDRLYIRGFESDIDKIINSKI